MHRYQIAELGKTPMAPQCYEAICYRGESKDI